MSVLGTTKHSLCNQCIDACHVLTHVTCHVQEFKSFLSCDFFRKMWRGCTAENVKDVLEEIRRVSL